jgi:hypothetical protein
MKRDAVNDVYVDNKHESSISSGQQQPAAAA